MANSNSASRLATLAFSLSIPLAACGQVTGLADDYHYDLEAGSPTGLLDSGAPADASTGDARATPDGAALQCSPLDQSRAMTEITNASGDNIPQACRRCIASDCCVELDDCTKNTECLSSMKCIFGCQKDVGNKPQCLSNCRTNFQNAVGSCLLTHCASPTCQLQ